MPVKDLCRQVRISVATCYRRKIKYMDVLASELRQVKGA